MDYLQTAVPPIKKFASYLYFEWQDPNNGGYNQLNNRGRLPVEALPVIFILGQLKVSWETKARRTRGSRYFEVGFSYCRTVAQLCGVLEHTARKIASVYGSRP